MAPARATAWPVSICQDPDVLTLDAHGHFVLCRVCFDHYVIFGGKKPKRVHMNACFRTCAWETHKRRTRAHNPAVVQARYKSESVITEVSDRLSYIRSLTSSITSAATGVERACDTAVPPLEPFVSSPTVMDHDCVRLNDTPRDQEGHNGSSLARGLDSHGLDKVKSLHLIERTRSKKSPELAPKIVAAMEISQLLNPVDHEPGFDPREAWDCDGNNSPSQPQNIPRLMEKYSACVNSLFGQGGLQSKEQDDTRAVQYCDDTSTVRSGFWESEYTIYSNSKLDAGDSQTARQAKVLACPCISGRRIPITASRDHSVAFMCSM